MVFPPNPSPPPHPAAPLQVLQKLSDSSNPVTCGDAHRDNTIAINDVVDGTLLLLNTVTDKLRGLTAIIFGAFFYNLCINYHIVCISF